MRTREALPSLLVPDPRTFWAVAYQDRIRGDRADNLERAIARRQQALETKSTPENGAVIQHNLGLAYVRRIRGDRAVNIERAIEYLRRVLEVRTRDDMPADWAQTQIGLGEAYRDRLPGTSRGEHGRSHQVLRRCHSSTTRRSLPARLGTGTQQPGHRLHIPYGGRKGR